MIRMISVNPRDRDRAAHARNQRELTDAALELRIRMQKPLTFAARLARVPALAAFAAHDARTAEALAAAAGEAAGLLGTSCRSVPRSGRRWGEDGGERGTEGRRDGEAGVEHGGREGIERVPTARGPSACGCSHPCPVVLREVLDVCAFVVRNRCPNHLSDNAESVNKMQTDYLIASQRDGSRWSELSDLAFCMNRILSACTFHRRILR